MQQNQLVEENLPLVKIVVNSQRRAAPFRYMCRDELIAAGNLGLVKAAANYNGDCPFRAYATSRIVTEMMELERQLRWGSVRHRIKQSRPKEQSYVPTDDFYDDITSPLDGVSKQVILWHYRDQYSITEIADKIGKHRTSVGRMLEESVRVMRQAHSIEDFNRYFAN